MIQLDSTTSHHLIVQQQNIIVYHVFYQTISWKLYNVTFSKLGRIMFQTVRMNSTESHLTFTKQFEKEHFQKFTNLAIKLSTSLSRTINTFLKPPFPNCVTRFRPLCIIKGQLLKSIIFCKTSISLCTLCQCESPTLSHTQYILLIE